MAVIIPFELKLTEARTDRATRGSGDASMTQAPAEILFFTGVRYVRPEMPDSASIGVPRRRRAKAPAAPVASGETPTRPRRTPRRTG